MNTDQIVNLIQSIGKIGGAIVGTYGANASNLWVALIGFAVALISFLSSHATNASPPPPSGTQGKLALVALLLFAVIPLNACKSSQIEVAYKSEAAAKTTVDAAMTAWGAYVSSQHPSASVQASVQKSFLAYQQAEMAAIDATAAAANLSGTNTLANANLSAAEAAGANALQELMNLLTQIGVKL